MDGGGNSSSSRNYHRLPGMLGGGGNGTSKLVGISDGSDRSSGCRVEVGMSGGRNADGGIANDVRVLSFHQVGSSDGADGAGDWDGRATSLRCVH